MSGMGGKSSSKSTTKTEAEPWKEVMPNLFGIRDDSENLYNMGGFSANPYPYSPSAGFGNLSQRGLGKMGRIASQQNKTENIANKELQAMMKGKNRYDYSQVKDNALASAIPAATSMFSGAGLADSSMAQDTVGRAATEAVAPIDFQAWQQGNQNTLNAASMTPAVAQARYMPAQMLQGAGAASDMMSQSMIDADMARYNQAQLQGAGNLQGYADMIFPMATMGGQSKSTTNTQSSQSPGWGSMLGSGMQMLGMFSDRRTKENIVKIGEHKGHNVYAYNYLWSPTLEIGVMADEVPHAVCGDVGGYAVVDYARL